MWGAFLLGFAGSFHCLLMCGPLLIFMYGTPHFSLLSQLFYHACRLLCYGLLGFLAAVIGYGFQFSFGHQFLAVLVGLIVCLVGLQKLLIHSRFSFQLRVLDQLALRFVKLFTHRKITNIGVRGFLNGFLPCGLVYVALSGAFLTTKPTDAFWFMIAFGVGTTPALIGILFFKPLYERVRNIPLHKFVPLFVILFGLWLILRGLGLGIPYVSPSAEKLLLTKEATSTIECH